MSVPRRAVVAGGATALVVVAVVVLVRTLQGQTDVSLLLLVLLVEALVALVAHAVLLLRRSAAATRRGTTRLERLTEAQAEAVAGTRAVAERLERVERRLEGTDERLRRMDTADVRLRRSRAEYAQMEALLELRSLAGADALDLPMPALRGWAASPVTLLTAVRAVLDLQPDLVVECGSGSSSVWLGHVLRRLGRGRYVALEHDERYAEVSRAEVARHGLSDVVEVRHAPLVPVTVDGEEQPWYDPAAFADLDGIGVVFVDGPPGATGPRARVPAVPLLGPRCVPGALVVLDDAARPDERAAVDHWVAGGATLLERRPWEKGVAVLRLDHDVVEPGSSSG